MKELTPQGSASRDAAGHRSRWLWFLVAACVLVTFIGLVVTRLNNEPASRLASTNAPGAATSANSNSAGRSRLPHCSTSSEPALTAEEIVARKLAQFGKSRRDLVHAIAKHHKVDVPTEVERFFDAVEGGRWEEIDAAHAALLESRENLNQPKSAELHQIWRGIQETWGAAKEIHNWPAQKLLDYGEAVLGSLKPGMIYVGGTDPGCFIPTFLNETSEGERHVTLTQNALADQTYLDYLNFLYGDQMKTLTHDDSQRAFQEYITDAQKRLQHDLDFPNEPKQVKPGEDIKMVENHVQIAGQIAVMAINEKLLQTLMDKNTDASFAIEQSFPFQSMYSNTVPLGPIMELRVPDAQSVFTAESAAQSVDYWRDTAQQILSDSAAANSPDVRMAYVKLASEQAALFLDRKFTSEAGQAYDIAIQLALTSPDVANYSKWLIPVVENALRIQPNNQQFQNFLKQLQATKKN